MSPTRVSRRRILISLLDITVVALTLILAFILRFDFNWDNQVLAPLFTGLPTAIIIYFSSFVFFGLYRGIYYYSSFSDLLNITKAVALAAVLTAAAILFIRQGKYPRSVLILHPMLAFLGVCWVRFGIRFIKTQLNMPRAYTGTEKSVLLIGAGELGESLLRQIQKTPDMNYRVAGFIDDDPAKWRMRIHGVTVFGGRNSLRDVLEQKQIDEIIITVATRRGELVRAVMDILQDMPERPALKVAPGLDEMLSAPGQGMAVRQIKPPDLLNRDVVKLDLARIARSLENKIVLVTGAGGTIGGELTRQVLQFHPAAILLLESHATSLFYQDAELRKASRGTRIVPLLGDIRDQALIDRIFNEHKPHVVLHAAAHKHVHQLEINVAEGIANNILGTYYMAQAARKHEAEAFVLVSTDKAVRPSSVMGATKRVAEMLVRSFSRKAERTRFVTVRFGNVLGSSGSVLEIFQRQLAEGGPLTVTDANVTRFFMTVPEAVQLILQASSMAKGGEIFVLRMGTPVKIIEMARNLIMLSGLEPDKDIKIQITGLKSGEKMDEELALDHADLKDSEHPSIMVLREAEVRDLEKDIMNLEILTRTAPSKTLVQLLNELVPSFTPAIVHGHGTGDA